jgi:hypothetical protein
MLKSFRFSQLILFLLLQVFSHPIWSQEQDQAAEIKEIDFVQVNALIQVGASEKALLLLPPCQPKEKASATSEQAQEQPNQSKSQALGQKDQSKHQSKRPKGKTQQNQPNTKQQKIHRQRYTAISEDDNIQAKLRLLSAQALIALGQSEKAEQCLSVTLPTKYQELQKLFHCKNAKLKADQLWQQYLLNPQQIDSQIFDQLIACSKEILNSDQLNDKLKDEIKLNQALNLLRKAKVTQNTGLKSQGVEALRALISESSDENIRASALGEWASFTGDDAPKRMLWIHFGDSPQARALRHDPPKISIHETFVRGEKLFEDRAYDLIFDTFNELLENPNVEAFMKQKSALLSAQTYLRIFDNYAEAERLLALAVKGPNAELVAQAWFDRAILWSRQDRWEEALVGMREYATRMPKTTRAREARYQKGRLLHQAGRYKEAVIAHEAFMASKPSDHERFRWFWGWSYYRMKDCKKAIEIWSKLDDHQNLLVGPKVHYWKAKCAYAAGNTKEALKEIGLVRKMESMSYYAILAQSLEGEIKGKEVIWPRAVSRTEIGAKPSLTPYLKKLGDKNDLVARLENLKDYSEIGIYHLARRELKALCGEQLKPYFTLTQKLGKPQAVKLCIDLHHWVNDEGSLWKIGKAQKLPWYSGLAKQSTEVRQAAYPPAYLDQAMAAAALEGDLISPWWILAHMLQESRYRTGVVSGAGAVGLMQILPRTGRLIWEIIKWPTEEFYRARLYESGLSIRYGTWYLMRLYEDLKHPIWSMAAYNGGPLRMANHIEKHLDLPFDEMLEEFGAHESRNYARKITDHFVRYLHMYGTEEERIHWTRLLFPPKKVLIPDHQVKF